MIVMMNVKYTFKIDNELLLSNRGFLEIMILDVFIFPG